MKGTRLNEQVNEGDKVAEAGEMSFSTLTD